MQNAFKLLLLCAFLALPMHAADSASTMQVLKQVQELAQDDVGNGYTDLDTYDVEEFNVGAVVNSLKSNFSRSTWGKCRFVVTVGRTENLRAMKALKQSNTTRTANLLSKLNEAGKLNTIIAAHWDGKSGEAVSCDVHLFEIFSNGGTRLVMEYSLTD